MACGPLLESLNTSGLRITRKLAVAIPNRLKTKPKGIFPQIFVKDQNKKKIFISNVSSKFLNSLCAEILASAHFFWEFTQSFVFKIQSTFRVQNKVKTKKKKVFTQNRAVFVSETCIT